MTDNGRGNERDGGVIHRREGLRIATWNIRSLNEKEDELIDEFERVNIDFLAITETKKKGHHTRDLKDGKMMLLSGVKTDKRAQAGVGCIMGRNLTKFLATWEAVSERLMRVIFNLGKQRRLSIIVLYGPNEDEKAEVKDKFWEDVTDLVENTKGDIILAGDLNGRVGRQDQKTKDVIGTHGEPLRNNNGHRIIDFCIQNNMLVMNTFFQHKDVHKYTREVKSRGERSIIDYIIVSRELRQKIDDVKVRRGPEINSDHYLVIAKTKIGMERKKAGTLRNRSTTGKIKSHTLSDKDIAQKYRDRVQELIEMADIKSDNDLEDLWKILRDSLVTAGREVCGVTRVPGATKQTAWWSESIKREVKAKKDKWRKYLANRDEHKYEEYKRQREKVKDMVLVAKRKS